MIVRPVAAALSLSLGLLLVACDEDSLRNHDVVVPDAGTSPTLPRFEDLKKGEWNEIVPGGETTCARGAPFKFWVYRGREPNLVVNFFGGGACWNKQGCSPGGSAAFYDDVALEQTLVELGASPAIFDMENPENPIHNDTQIMVPYCTGDIHIGDTTATYGTGDEAFEIEHRGAANSKAVLAWIYDNFEAPERVLTTGCSAGGYGALVWGARLMRHYPDAKQVMLSDSAAGVITPGFFQYDFPVWNARGSFPGWIEGFDRREVTDLTEAYVAIAKEFPDATLAQYNTVNDGEQGTFYIAMGGERADWSPIMRSQLKRIHKRVDNFRSYVAPGSQHCVLVLDNFYKQEVNGVKFTHWLRDLLDGKAKDVACDGCK